MNKRFFLKISFLSLIPFNFFLTLNLKNKIISKKIGKDIWILNENDLHS